MNPLTLEAIESLRDIRYHRTATLRVRTEQAAKAFIDEVGFCFLYGEKGVEIPTLWAATCGSRRPMPHDHFDADVGRVWEWKDALSAQKAIYYGKLLRAKPTLVSLELLPYFYALSPNYGDVMDYLEQYKAGELSLEAKRIYEALLEKGALATTQLRQVVGLAGSGRVASLFERAITELQTQMKIVMVGISNANRWGYAYVYDLFMRRFPQMPEIARAISIDQARETLFTRYLQNVIAIDEAACRRLFRWDDWAWNRLLERLIGTQKIRRTRIEGLNGDFLMLAVIAQNLVNEHGINPNSDSIRKLNGKLG